MSPRVTVLMPVYNCEQFLARAIGSILDQAMDDFELLIVDDCSTDGSRARIAEFRDSRIRLLRMAENSGIGPALNRGITESAGEYIARMDADDVSFPDRLERQAAFLDQHPMVGLCGGRAVPFQHDEEIDFSRRGERLEESPESLRMGLLFGPGVVHPTVMFRRRVFLENDLRYAPLRYAQDYELWTRAFFMFDPANISDTVLFYRVHSGGAASRVRDTQGLVKQEIWRPLLERLGATVSEDELEAHSQLADLRVRPDWQLVLRVHAWVRKLLKIGGGTWWDERSYRVMLSRKFFGVLQYATRFGLRPLWLALVSSLRPLRSATFLDSAKFIAKCAIRYENTGGAAHVR